MKYLWSVIFGIFLIAPGHLQTATQSSEHKNVQSHAIDEDRLHEDYISFLNGLDATKIEENYRGAVLNIKSEEPDKQKHGLAVLGASGEVDAIAWIVPLIDSENRDVKIQAGLALDKIVSGYELRRRDPSKPDRIVILPRSASDIDLRSLAWIILKMMRVTDDGSIPAYAATMAGYLGLSDFVPELERLLTSRHPSVSNSAKSALSVLRDN